MNHCAPSGLPKPCLAAVKSRQTKNSLNSLPSHHLPTSLSALAGQQWALIIASRWLMKHADAMLGVSFHYSSSGATLGTYDGRQIISMCVVRIVSSST